MRYCVDCWNAPWPQSKSSIQINVIHLTESQLISFVISTHAPLLSLKALFRIHQSFAQLLGFSLWSKHGSHSSGFSLKALFVTIWLAEAVCLISSWATSVRRPSPRNHVSKWNRYQKEPIALVATPQLLLSKQNCLCCRSTTQSEISWDSLKQSVKHDTHPSSSKPAASKALSTSHIMQVQHQQQLEGSGDGSSVTSTMTKDWSLIRNTLHMSKI